MNKKTGMSYLEIPRLTLYQMAIILRSKLDTEDDEEDNTKRPPPSPAEVREIVRLKQIELHKAGEFKGDPSGLQI